MTRLGFLLLGGILAVGATLSAAPVPQLVNAVVEDRAGFIPHRKYFPLPGKAIGVMASDVRAMTGQEGRSGPPNAYGFSAGGGSYRWVYTPADGASIIQNLQVHVGAKGDRIKIYPALNMADPKTLNRWDIEATYALVEVEVNDGLGAPADEGFVATNMKRLDGTRDYALNLPEVVADAKKRYQRHLEDQKGKIETTLTAAAEKILQGKNLTGARQTTELFYLTWLPERERVRLHFRTQITDGNLQQGIGIEPVRPIPLPVPDQPRRGGGPLAFFPPAPPIRPIGQFGTIIGVELGLAIEVTKTGKVDRVEELPVQAFHRNLQPPPAVRRKGDPLPITR